MQAQEQLRIYALGPTQVLRGERALSAWSYLESKELLFYLLIHTQKPKTSKDEPRGKTKEQIGVDLWPNATPSQLSANLKSRLYEMRRTLGGDVEWVVFKNGQYLFNLALDYWFDVEMFERKVAEARNLQTKAPAEAIVCFQDALQFYRGDFLEDLRKGRTRKESGLDFDEDEREWYLRKREELEGLYLDSIRRAGQLLLDAGSHDQAVEVYRKAVDKDDYDDEAHYGVMRGYALQGKRTHALQHYRKLVKRRSDTPPEPDIVQLFERLRRGEEIAPKPTGTADVPVAMPEAEQKPPAPFQSRATPLHFVGRAVELSSFRDALMQTATPRIYCIVGMGGIGKTTLAIHLAHALRDQFPDGVLWADVSRSEPLAIIANWARAYQCDFSSLPDLDSRAAALRNVLADKTALLILDDVWDAERARVLLLGGPRCATLITSRDADIAAALDAQLISLPTLAAEESHQLLSRIVGPARVAAEPAAADEICELVGHLPLALEIAAHRLWSRPRWALREMAERLREQRRRLDELKIEDQEVRASFAISWDALDERLRHGFAQLAAFRGRAFTAEAFAAVAAMEQRAATDSLDSLVALSLLWAEGQAHYRQHPLLVDFAREKRRLDDAADARMAQYYLRFATEQRQNYLALEQERNNLAAGITVAYRQKLWQVVIDYGDVLTNGLFARGLYTDARQMYPLVCEAAQQPEIEDQDAYIAATLNWGRACIEQSDYSEAKEHLEHGLQVSHEVDDRHGVASAQFYLGWVAIEQGHEGKYTEAQKLLEESQRIREQLGDMLGVAEVLFYLARIEYRYRKYVEAERLAKQALDFQQTANSAQNPIGILRLLALIANRRQDYKLAESYCQHALELCEQLQDRTELASALYVLSQIRLAQDDLHSAQEYAESSLESFKLIGDRKSQTYVFEHLSRVYNDLHRYDLAYEAGMQSLSLYREFQDDWGVVFVLCDLGDVLKNMNQAEQARQRWSEALTIAEKLQHPLAKELMKRLGSV